MLSDKDPNSTEFFSFNYGSDARLVGDSIVSAVVTNSVIQGADADSDDMLIGPVIVSGSTIYQMVTAGLAGRIYKLLCYATTTNGQVLDASGEFLVK
jgi:hypothetical protein